MNKREAAKYRLKRAHPHAETVRGFECDHARPPVAPSVIPWCTTIARPFRGSRSESGIADKTHTFKKVRCPDCGRRLQLMTVDIEHGYGDFWPCIPPHKIRELHARPGKKPKAKHKGYGSRRGA